MHPDNVLSPYGLGIFFALICLDLKIEFVGLIP